LSKNDLQGVRAHWAVEFTIQVNGTGNGSGNGNAGEPFTPLRGAGGYRIP